MHFCNQPIQVHFYRQSEFQHYFKLPSFPAPNQTSRLSVIKTQSYKFYFSLMGKKTVWEVCKKVCVGCEVFQLKSWPNMEMCKKRRQGGNGFTSGCCCTFAHATNGSFSLWRHSSSMNHFTKAHKRHSKSVGFTSCSSFINKTFSVTIHFTLNHQFSLTALLTFSCCNLCSGDVSDSDLSRSDRSSAWLRYHDRFVLEKLSSLCDKQRP